MSVCAQAGGFIPSGLLAIISSCRRVAVFVHYFLVEVLRYSLHLVPCAKWATKFLERLLRDCERCPGKYSPCLLVSFFCYQEGLDGISSLISDRIYYVALFSIILQSRIELNRGNKKSCQYCYSGFYYQLTLSRSDFENYHTCQLG